MGMYGCMCVDNSEDTLVSLLSTITDVSGVCRCVCLVCVGVWVCVCGWMRVYVCVGGCVCR